jgi:hypothetical protein
MAAQLIANFSPGRIAWEGSRDREGHREFIIRHRVFTTSSLDGPLVVMNAPGLPFVGSLWAFGNDNDLWAFCYPDMRVIPDQTPGGEPHFYWTVEQRFGTRPIERCQDTGVEDPLQEPAKISGGTRRKTIAATEDKDGNKITSSSHEAVLGPEIEFDSHDHVVTIEQNIGTLGQETFLPLVNTVNDSTLWGFTARKVKLSAVSWSRQLWKQCAFFYTRRFEFEINEDTFDTTPSDVGTKVLSGKWVGCPPTGWTAAIGTNKDKPSHFMRARDCQSDELITLQLDGAGEPNLTDTIKNIPLAANSPSGKLEYYKESNFLTLGIPTSL